MTTSKILETKAVEVDWNVGTLVTRETGLVLMVTDDGCASNFKGTVIASDAAFRPVGFYYSNWKKSDFRPFEGRIEISNL